MSIQQFVANCRGDREKAADIILSQELLLMHELQYHLTVHNPFRPLEGLLIDIKVMIVLMCNFKSDFSPFSILHFLFLID